MSDLDFIKDGELRKTLEDSFEYVLALYTLTKDPKQSEIFSLLYLTHPTVRSSDGVIPVSVGVVPTL